MKTSVFRGQYSQRFCDPEDRSQIKSVDKFVNSFFDLDYMSYLLIAMIIINLYNQYMIV